MTQPTFLAASRHPPRRVGPSSKSQHSVRSPSRLRLRSHSLCRRGGRPLGATSRVCGVAARAVPPSRTTPLSTTPTLHLPAPARVASRPASMRWRCWCCGPEGRSARQLQRRTPAGGWPSRWRQQRVARPLPNRRQALPSLQRRRPAPQQSPPRVSTVLRLRRLHLTHPAAATTALRG